MEACNFGLFAGLAVTIAFRRLPIAAGFHGLADFIDERGDFGVGFTGQFLGQFHDFLLGRGGSLAGFFQGRIGVGFTHRLSNPALFIWGKLGQGVLALRVLIVFSGFGVIFGLLVIFINTLRLFIIGLRLVLRRRLVGLFHDAITTEGVVVAADTLRRVRFTRLVIFAVMVLGVLIIFINTLRLLVGLRAISRRRLVGLPVLAGFHGLSDFFEERGDGRIGTAGGVVADLVGFLLCLHGNLLGLRRVLMGFADGGILPGLLHRLVEALLFFRRELGRKARVSAAFGGRAVGADVRAWGLIGSEAEGGEEEQG